MMNSTSVRIASTQPCLFNIKTKSLQIMFVHWDLLVTTHRVALTALSANFHRSSALSPVVQCKLAPTHRHRPQATVVWSSKPVGLATLPWLARGRYQTVETSSTGHVPATLSRPLPTPTLPTRLSHKYSCGMPPVSPLVMSNSCKWIVLLFCFAFNLFLKEILSYRKKDGSRI